MAYSSIIDNLSVSTVLGDLLFEDEFIAVLRSIDSSRFVEDMVRIVNFHEIEFLINNFNVCLKADGMNKQEQMDPKTLEVFENVRCELLLADGVDLWVAAREKKVFEFVLGLSEG